MADEEEQELDERIRMQAMIRQTGYNHPELTIKHEPINQK